MSNGPPHLPNKRRASLASDLCAAESVDAAAAVVVLGEDPAARLNAAFDLRVKWVVTTDQVIRIVPRYVEGVEMSHAFLANGEDVFAAGEAEIVPKGDGGYMGLEITNHSGHYEPPASTLKLAVALFRRHGIEFEPDAQVRYQGK